MTALAIILATAAVGLTVAQWFRLPSIPLLVVGGIALSGFGLLPDRELIQHVLMLGLTFLVFSGGLELNPARIGKRHRRAVLVVGLAQFFALGMIGMGIARLFGFSWFAAGYLAIAVATSSTIVVVRILQQRRQFFEPFGRLVLGVLLLQDLLSILLIASLNHLSDGLGAVVLDLLVTLGLMALSGVFIRWISPWLLLRRDLDQETTLLVSLAILFFFVGLSYWMGLPLPVGAFLAGVALSGFPVNGLIRGQVSSLSTFFVALFFILLGATLDWPGLQQIVVSLLLVLGVLIVTPLIVLLVVQGAGLSTRAALESGLLLAQCSEFSLIIALLGVSQGHIDNNVLLTVALLTVVSMALTPFIATDAFTWRLLRLYPGGREPEAVKREGHVLQIGCGNNSRTLLDLLLLAGREVVVIEEDPAVVEELTRRGIASVRGNGADPRVLRAAHAREARVIVSTMRRLTDNKRLLHYVKNVPVFIRVFETDDATTLQNLGGKPILESHAAAEQLLQWIEKNMGLSQPPRAS